MEKKVSHTVLSRPYAGPRRNGHNRSGRPLRPPPNQRLGRKHPDDTGCNAHRQRLQPHRRYRRTLLLPLRPRDNSPGRMVPHTRLHAVRAHMRINHRHHNSIFLLQHHLRTFPDLHGRHRLDQLRLHHCVPGAGFLQLSD